MKQLKPRDKITQKMTRDGAVEINETQQTAERISSREADSDFSQPDTATAERVMEHLDAAHTRKASKKPKKTGFFQSHNSKPESIFVQRGKNPA